MKGKIAFIFLALTVFLVSFFVYKEMIKPHSTKEGTYQILVGSFRNVKTGEMFDYADKNGYLFECQQTQCKTVYFDVNEDGSINQIYEIGNPLFATITNVAPIDAEHVKYSLLYQENGKSITKEYVDDLCERSKGAKQCFEPGKKGQVASLHLHTAGGETEGFITIFENVLEADVLRIISTEYRP